MDERRTTIRVPVGLEGSYRVVDRPSQSRLGMTEDVGLGGMRFACPEILYPGDTVAVALNLPKEGPIELRGVVRWSRELINSDQDGCEAGLRWSGVDSHTQAKLNSFLVDRTQAASSVIFSKAQLPKLIRWPLALTSGLAIGSGLLFIVWLWFRQGTLGREAKLLQALIRVYQDQIDRLLR